MAGKAGQNRTSREVFLTRSILVVGVVGSVASVVSLVTVNIWLFLAFASAAGAAFLGLGLWSLIGWIRKLMRLVEHVDELVTSNHSLRPDVWAQEDLARLVHGCRDELIDICVEVDGKIASAFVGDVIRSPKYLVADAVQSALAQIARTFRVFAGDPAISVLIVGRDSKNRNRLITLLTDGVPNRRPTIEELAANCKLEETVPGKVLTTGHPVITPSVANLAVDEVWDERENFVKSLVCWPIHVGGQVVAVLKVESAVENSLHDNAAMRMLAELCSRKLAFIIEWGYCLERALALSAPRPTSERRHVG